MVCDESKVSDPWLCLPQQRLWNSTPGAQGMALYVGKDSAPSGRASWSVLAMNPACFVFAIQTENGVVIVTKIF